METYYAKPWLQKAATNQMLFTQIYYLKKKYGPAAEHLTLAMRSQLSPPRYAWQWENTKPSARFKNCCEKLRGFDPGAS